MSLTRKAALLVINNPGLEHQNYEGLLTILTDVLLLPPVSQGSNIGDVKVLYYKLYNKTPEEATLFLLENGYYNIAIQRIKELHFDYIYSILIYLLEHNQINGVKMLEFEFQPIDYNVINENPELLDNILSEQAIIYLMKNGWDPINNLVDILSTFDDDDEYKIINQYIVDNLTQEQRNNLYQWEGLSFPFSWRYEARIENGNLIIEESMDENDDREAYDEWLHSHSK